MKNIELVNKKTYQALDHSTVESVSILFHSLAEVEEARKQFTEENMKRVLFGTEEYLCVKPLSLNIEVTEKQIIATFMNKKATETELLQLQMTELQEAIAQMTEA